MMKKTMPLLFWLLLTSLLLAACSTHAEKSATYQVATGDKIKITVDLKAGYDLAMDVPFVVSQRDKDILIGTFDFLELYDTYYQVVADDPNSTLLAEGTKDGNDYFFYEVLNADGETVEHNYFVKVANSQTVVIIGSIASQEEAEAAFAATVISLGEDE